MLRVKIKFVSGWFSHRSSAAEMYSFILSLRAHLVVAGLGVGLVSVQFSCSAVVMILCTASSGGSVVVKQRVMDGGGGFQVPSADSSVPRNSIPSQVAV